MNNQPTPTPELVALFHPLKYYVRAARSQLGSCRPDDDEGDADFWDGLTAVMKAMDGDSGWDDAHVHGWRMVDGIRVFSITPPSGLLPPQEFVRYDDHLATRAATVPQGVLDDVMREALSEVIRATRAYLPPDGISPQDCISRVLAATDNARINAAMGEVS